MTLDLSQVRKAVAALVGSAVVGAVAIVAPKLGVPTEVVVPVDAFLVGLVTKLVHRIPNEVSL